MRRAAAMVLGLALVLIGHADASSTWQVAIRRTGFVPRELTITIGDTVCWTNEDTVQHTTTSDSDPPYWDSGRMNPTWTHCFTFDESNSYKIYNYHSSLDPPSFAGRITQQTELVTPTPGPTPTATPPTATPTATPTPTPTATPTPTPTATPAPSATPTAPPTATPATTPTPTPTATSRPAPTSTPLPTPTVPPCRPTAGQAIQVLDLYVWTDGIWQETNGHAGLQRGYTCATPDRALVRLPS